MSDGCPICGDELARSTEMVERMSRRIEPRDDAGSGEALGGLLAEARSIMGDNRETLPCEACKGAGYVLIPGTAGRTADCEPCGAEGRVPNEVAA